MSSYLGTFANPEDDKIYNQFIKAGYSATYAANQVDSLNKDKAAAASAAATKTKNNKLYIYIGAAVLAVILLLKIVKK